MGIKEDLQAFVHRTFSVENWTVQDGRVVPYTDNIPLNNTAKNYDLATFLYADMSGSTAMVEQLSWQRCAELYKNYLYCASRLIRHFNGEVVAFDGDRVMGVFLGTSQSTNAVKCALRINWARLYVVQPKYDQQYGAGYKIGHTIGIDASSVKCCRTGIRGDNDLVWVGSAPNIAAKLTGLDENCTWITDTVYDRMASEVKIHATGPMWEQRTWTARNDRIVYRSRWQWPL